MKIIINGKEAELPGGSGGMTPYDYAVSGGYTGTEEEFKATLSDAATKGYVDDAIAGLVTQNQIQEAIRAAINRFAVNNWAAVATPNAADLYSIAYGNGVFVSTADGSDQAAYSTNNGKSWTAATLPSSGEWDSIVYGNGVFVAVANNSNQAAYSIDGGKTWTGATLPSSPAWSSITYGNNMFVTVASGNKMAYSTDNGKIWMLGFLPNGDWCSIAYGDGVFVAAGYKNKKMAYSLTGDTP